VKADTERAESAGAVMPFEFQIAASCLIAVIALGAALAAACKDSRLFLPRPCPLEQKKGTERHTLAHWHTLAHLGLWHHKLAHTGTLVNVEEQFGQQAQAAGNNTMKRARPARPWPNNTSRVAHTVAHTGTLARWPSMRS